MSTPTATPTEAHRKLWTALYNLAHREIFEDYAESSERPATQLLADSEARAVEAAVAAIIEKNAPEIAKANAELARLRDELAKIYSLVAPHGCDLAPNGIWETARAVSDLLASLRAEVEALKQSIESGQRVLREDAERNAARAERAEAEVERLTMDNRILTTRANSGDAQFTAVHARAERAEAECLEQARLLGMSASREASLLGKISRLEHQLEK